MLISSIYSIVFSRVAGLVAVNLAEGRGESRVQPSSGTDLLTGSQGAEPVLHCPLTSGELTLTQMQDGTLCILFNGIPCTDGHWMPTEMQIARLKFEELKARLATGAEAQRGAKRRQGPKWVPRGYASDPQFGASPCHYPVQH